MSQPYQVEGDFAMGRARQHFVHQVVAKDEKAATDRVQSLLGSRHGVNRRQITVASVQRIQADEVTDAVAIVELRGAKK